MGAGPPWHAARVYGRRLALTAATYVVLHHLGLLPGGLGPAPDHTQWADWIDLLVPFLVLAPAAATLDAAGASRRTWTVFGVGAVAYASGHGIHLAANSVGNAAPGPTEHLWDEVVGHEIWYLGVALVAAALIATMADHPPDRPWIGVLLAVGVGVTWGTNAVGGGALPLAFVAAVAAAVVGWRHRDTLAGLALVAAVPALAIIVGAGVLALT